MALSEFILEFVDILSSETTRKDLFAFILLYSLLGGILFFGFYDKIVILIFLNNKFVLILTLSLISLILLFLSFFSFNIGLKFFYEDLYSGVDVIRSMGEEKLKSMVKEYIETLSEGKQIRNLFNQFTSELKKSTSEVGKGRKLIGVCFGLYLVLFFLSLIFFFSAIWAISYEALLTNNLNLFKKESSNYILFIPFLTFLILLSSCENKSEGLNFLFNTTGQDSKIHKGVDMVLNIFLDSLLWYFTYTPNEEKQEWRESFVYRMMRSKIFGRLFKIFFALNPPELVSGIRVASSAIFIPPIGDSKEYSSRLSSIKTRLEMKFSVLEAIKGEPKVGNNLLTISWDDFVKNIKDENSPISSYFLLSKNEYNKKNETDAIGVLLSFVHNPYVYKETYRRPEPKTMLIEENILVVYILLIIREDKYRQYEKFLATIF